MGLLESYLRQTYSWFLDKHSGDMGKGILSEVAETIHYSLNPLLGMISQLFLTILLICSTSVGSSSSRTLPCELIRQLRIFFF